MPVMRTIHERRPSLISNDFKGVYFSVTDPCSWWPGKEAPDRLRNLGRNSGSTHSRKMAAREFGLYRALPQI